MVSEGIATSTPQTEARTSFSRVKQIKNLRETLWWNASACISHFQSDKVSSIVCFQCELPPFRHGINGVRNQVTQDVSNQTMNNANSSHVLINFQEHLDSTW